jgi:hypothetical protein
MLVFTGASKDDDKVYSATFFGRQFYCLRLPSACSSFRYFNPTLRTTSIKQLLKLPYQNYQFKSKVPFDLIDINIFNV